MPKHEKGTPKEIANRWKTKGLQKLRRFCEMCQKQCRDENGFKCHLTSESHQRQLLLFAETPDKYISQYSQEFEQNFVRVLRTGYGTRRVRANEVYQEYIKDKMHVHMNSTQWTTLTQFVQWLGNKKKCKIDLNEKGWYIQYIDYEEEARKEEEAKREKQELDDEQKQLDQIEAQVQRARALHGEQEYADATELVRNDDEKITIDLGVNKKPDIEELNRAQPMLGVSVFDRAEVKKEDDTERSGHHLSKRRSRSRSRSSERQSSRRKRDFRQRDEARKPSSSRDEKLKKSALDEIREMEERRKEKKNRKDYWMHTGIVIKVITRKLGDDYYKRKGVVKELIDEYTAKVAIDDVTVKLDQSHVETVVPQVGREMLIVNGAYRGTKATLQRINVNDFSVILRLSEGLCKGREVTLPYEDASKLA